MLNIVQEALFSSSYCCRLIYTVAMKSFCNQSHFRRRPVYVCSTFAFQMSILTTVSRIDLNRLTSCILKHIHSYKHLLLISILWVKEKATPVIICAAFKRHQEGGQRARGLLRPCLCVHMCECLRVRWSHFDWGVSFRSARSHVAVLLQVFKAQIISDWKHTWRMWSLNCSNY